MPISARQRALLERLKASPQWQTFDDEDVLPSNPLEQDDPDASVYAWPGDPYVTGRAIVLPQKVAGGQVTNMLEPRDGSLAWWLKTSDFGGRFIGVLPSEGNEIPIASLEKAPGPTRPIAVTLFRSDRDVTTEGNTDVYALITYGAGGAQNTFRCDWTQGGSLCIPATNIRVSALVYSPAEGEASSPTAGITLGVTFGLGPVTPSRPPTFTTPIRLLDITEPDSVLAFDVPDFARRVYPLIGLDSANLSQLLFELRTGANVAIISRVLTAESLLQGFPVPGACTHGILQNLTGAPLPASVMFELGL